MAMKKETGMMKGEACMYCGNMGCHCAKWMHFTIALVLLVFGYMLWSGRWTLEQSISLLWILLGLKFLLTGFKCCR